VYLDGDRWRGAASLGYGPNGRRIRKRVSGATKAEVLRKLRDLRSELNAGHAARHRSPLIAWLFHMNRQHVLPDMNLSDDGLTGAVDVQRAADPIANGSEVAARRPASSRATVMTSWPQRVEPG
jgi:hypothetical protein